MLTAVQKPHESPSHETLFKERLQQQRFMLLESGILLSSSGPESEAECLAGFVAVSLLRCHKFVCFHFHPCPEDSWSGAAVSQR